MVSLIRSFTCLPVANVLQTLSSLGLLGKLVPSLLSTEKLKTSGSLETSRSYIKRAADYAGSESR